MSTRNGALLAIEDVNAEGGIRGRKIELITKDDRQDPKLAAQAVAELAKDGVVAIIGPTASTAALGAVPAANELKMLLISPAVSSEAFSGKDDFFIRNAPLVSAIARSLAEYLYDKRKWRSVAAAFDTGNRAYSEDVLNNFKRAFEALGGRVVSVSEIGPNPAHAEIARKLLAQPVDGIYLAAYEIDTAYICQELRKLGSNVPVAEGGAALTEVLIRYGGVAVEGLVSPHNAFIEPGDERLQPFRELHRKRFGGEPTNITGLGYEAANVLIEALKQSRDRTPVALKETILRTKHFKSIFGDFDFDAFGDAIRPAVIVTIENGKFVRAR